MKQKMPMNRMNTFLFHLFMLVVILAPLPFGSNREWSWTLCAVLISGLTLAWAAISMFRPERATISISPAIMIGFLLVCAWAFLQTSSSVPDTWKHPLWAMSAQVLPTIDALTPSGSISLAPDDTFTALMRLLTYGLVFFLAFQWGREPHLAKKSFQWLILAGFCYAIYGLASFWSGSSTLFWFENPGYKQDLRSTFVNRNHYATYAGIVLLCAIALFYQLIAVHTEPSSAMPQKGRIPPGARVASRLERVEEFILTVWKPLVVILLLSAALILTHSRGGFLSTMAGGVVLLYCINFRRRIRSGRSFAAIGLALGIAMISFWLTSEALLDRIDRQGLSDNMRITAYDLITESTQDNPWLGFGYGTFADSFRLYRTGDITGYLDRAHNTYLENIFELGWPVAILLFAVVAIVCLFCVRGLRNRARDWIYPATGIAATVLVGIHSYFDFSLQIPAVAMTYACILGIAYAQSYSSQSSN